MPETKFPDEELQRRSDLLVEAVQKIVIGVNAGSGDHIAKGLQETLAAIRATVEGFDIRVDTQASIRTALAVTMLDVGDALRRPTPDKLASALAHLEFVCKGIAAVCEIDV